MAKNLDSRARLPCFEPQFCYFKIFSLNILLKILHSENLNELFCEHPYTHHLDSMQLTLYTHLSICPTVCSSVRRVIYIFQSKPETSLCFGFCPFLRHFSCEILAESMSPCRSLTCKMGCMWTKRNNLVGKLMDTKHLGP